MSDCLGKPPLPFSYLGVPRPSSNEQSHCPMLPVHWLCATGFCSLKPTPIMFFSEGKFYLTWKYILFFFFLFSHWVEQKKEEREREKESRWDQHFERELWKGKGTHILGSHPTDWEISWDGGTSKLLREIQRATLT